MGRDDRAGDVPGPHRAQTVDAVGGRQSDRAQRTDRHLPQRCAGQFGGHAPGAARPGCRELPRAAHTLKSNSNDFGAHELADLCRELEAKGRNDDLDGAAALLAAAEAAYAPVAAALEEMRRRQD
ncbi:MAG: Hpt domain-containing protein [Caldilineaceae bacterium]